MKLRLGFVSNSSSSSFIVAFKQRPESVEELRQMLFGDQQTYSYDTWGLRGPEKLSWTTQEMAQTVFNDLLGQTPLTEEGIAELSEDGTYGDIPDVEYPNYNMSGEELEREWDLFQARSQEHGVRVAKQFVADNPGCEFYVLTYSDEGGPYGSALEHGGIFDGLPHIYVSHH